MDRGCQFFGLWIRKGEPPLPSFRQRGSKPSFSFEFKKPVFVGDLISCYAEIVSEGRTSMKVKVEVYAEHMKKGETSCIKVTEAVLTYVAIDENRKPMPLPSI